MPDLSPLAESGRAIIVAARLDRTHAKTLQFDLGDLVAEVPDEELDDLAQRINTDVNGYSLRSYKQVALAWPKGSRVEASWTAHRTLKDADNRFELIHPGMTLRKAQEAIGKRSSDTEHPARWDLARRVPFLMDQLSQPEVNAAVREALEERGNARAARAARATAKLVEEDVSAQRREQRRLFREMRDARSPETAAYATLFKIRNDHREYLRAVGRGLVREDGFFPPHLQAQLVEAVGELAVMAIEVVASMSGTEPTASAALGEIERHLNTVQQRTVLGGFQGAVFPMGANGEATDPFAFEDEDLDDEPVGTSSV